MGTLRQKLAFSYGLLTLVMMGVSAVGIYHFVRLGRAVDTILANNYKSIIAAENMEEALERQDSAAMFFIAGHLDKARQQFSANVQKFTLQFEIAAHNVTEPGEDKIISDIQTQSSGYSRALEDFLGGKEARSPTEASQAYFDRLEPAFVALRSRLEDLLHLNQQAMVNANERALSESWNAQASTVTVVFFGVLFAVAFAWRFSAYIVDPLLMFTEKAQQIAEGDFDQHIDISSRDEIGVLATEFNRMTAHLKDLKKTNYWQLQIEQKKSNAVIESIYEPVIVTDAQGRVIKLNHNAAQLFGVSKSAEEIGRGLSLSDFSAGEQILRAVEAAVSMQRPVADENEAALVPVKVGGADRSYRLRTTPMRDENGRLLGAVSLLEDITAIREVDRIKTDFISIASGKLRAPLQSLELALHTLAGHYAGELSEQQLDLLMDARRSAEQLDDLMGDLLQLAEIDSGAHKMSFEAYRPIDLVREAILQHAALADSRHIKLEHTVAPDLPYITADRQAVKRIFDNLLSNALRHTNRDGQVTISAEERENNVVFSVRDTGEGIPEEYLPNIFSRFVHAHGKPGGGTGLGLALVKRLVEAEGGQVAVSSVVGSGTVFTFTLPSGGSTMSARVQT
jgi:NtrC-family two-component system sensor histidine kinase KinB